MTEPVTAHTQRFVRARVDARPRPGLRPALPGRGLGRVVLPRRRRARRRGTRATATRTGRARRARVASAARRGRPARPTSPTWSAPARCPATSGWCCSPARLLREGVLQQSALSRQRRLLHGREDRGARRRRARRRRRAARRSSTAACPPPAIEELDFAPLLRAARGDRPRRRRRGRARRRDAMLARWSAAVTAVSRACAAHRVHRRSTSCAGRCSSSAASPASAGTSSPRSGCDSGRGRGTALVLEVDRDLAVVQVLEGTDGHRPARHPRRLRRASPLRIPVGDRLAGPGLQRPRRAARRRPAGPRRATRRRSPGCPLNPTHGASRPPSRCSPASRPSTRSPPWSAARSCRSSRSAGLPHLELADPDRRAGHRRRRAVQRRLRRHGPHPRRRGRRPRRARGARRPPASSCCCSTPPTTR